MKKSSDPSAAVECSVCLAMIGEACRVPRSTSLRYLEDDAVHLKRVELYKKTCKPTAPKDFLVQNAEDDRPKGEVDFLAAYHKLCTDHGYRIVSADNAIEPLPYSGYESFGEFLSKRD